MRADIVECLEQDVEVTDCAEAASDPFQLTLDGIALVVRTSSP